MLPGTKFELQQNNILREQNAFIYEISIKKVKFSGFPYGVMGDQSYGLIGCNQCTQKGWIIKHIKIRKSQMLYMLQCSVSVNCKYLCSWGVHSELSELVFKHSIIILYCSHW